jgi:hypothetical protein
MRFASGDLIESDGGIAVIEMKDCEAPDTTAKQTAEELPARPGSRIRRFVRTQALSVHDLWQSNAIYESFEISRSVIHTLKNRRLRQRQSEEEALRAQAIPRGETSQCDATHREDLGGLCPSVTAGHQ